MGNLTNRQNNAPAASELESDKAVDNTKCTNSDLTTDQPDSVLQEQSNCEENQEVYAKVTVLSKKLRTEEDGTIILSPISKSTILSYVELSGDQNSGNNSNSETVYYMFHGGTQLTICEVGQFPSLAPPPHCDRRIKFTFSNGTDGKFIMSNMDDTLYLRGRTGTNNDVVVRKKVNNKSYFIADLQGTSTHPPGQKFLFFLEEDNSLYWRYVNGEVILENYASRPPHTTGSFHFVIQSAPNAKFADDCAA